MTRERWLDEGLAVLSEQGIAGVKIDRLVGRVGLTKGSFFHHFDGVAAYRVALLDRWAERTHVDIGRASPEALLGDLASRVGDLFDVRLEAAIRAWALQDRQAAEVLERVDRARLAALDSVWAQLVDDPDRAHSAALLPHLIVIGASVALPSPTRSELEGVFALLAELAPSVRSRR